MLQRIKCLLVGDLEEDLLELTALLQRDDVELLTARSGEHALELLLGHDVALAFLGVQMPDMDGFELAERIRSDTASLHEQQDKSPLDQSKIDELATRVEWSTRIFEDRRKSIRYACEVPVIIEKRLFALSRAIQQIAE